MRAVILAGGRCSRFGSEKALALLDGRPLVQHVIDRLAPQVDAIAISTNATDGRFNAFGLSLLPDLLPDVAGPLAGVCTALATWPQDEVVAVAVDQPLVPPDLVARLRAGAGDRLCAYAETGERHSVALWCAPGAVEDLRRFLKQGKRRLGDWLAEAAAPVEFPPGETDDLGVNINTAEDLVRAAGRGSKQDG